MDDTTTRLLDIHEIQQVYLTYAMAMDTKTWALMDSCFAFDAKIHISTVAAEIAGAKTLTKAGWLGIVEKTEETLDAAQHYIYPPLIKFENSRAYTRAYFWVQHVRNSIAPNSFFYLGGWYDGELVKREGKWQLLEHHIVENWLSGNPEVLIGLGLPAGAVRRTSDHQAPSWMIEN